MTHTPETETAAETEDERRARIGRELEEEFGNAAFFEGPRTAPDAHLDDMGD